MTDFYRFVTAGNGGAAMINIAVLGYGTIGSGVVEVLKLNGESIKKSNQCKIHS